MARRKKRTKKGLGTVVTQTTSTKLTGKNLLKSAAIGLGALGVGTLGFIGANQLNKHGVEKITKGKTLVKGGLAVSFGTGAIMVKNVYLKTLLAAISLFFGVSSLNDIAASPSFQGLGGFKSKLGSVLRKFIPQLNGGVSLGNSDVWLNESEYQILSSTPINGFGNTEVPAALLGMGNPAISQMY